jgi:hypothetical protein
MRGDAAGFRMVGPLRPHPNASHDVSENNRRTGNPHPIRLGAIGPSGAGKFTCSRLPVLTYTAAQSAISIASQPEDAAEAITLTARRRVTPDGMSGVSGSTSIAVCRYRHTVSTEVVMSAFNRGDSRVRIGGDHTIRGLRDACHVDPGCVGCRWLHPRQAGPQLDPGRVVGPQTHAAAAGENDVAELPPFQVAAAAAVLHVAWPVVDDRFSVDLAW